MPKFCGVYKDTKGTWYLKASTHKDPLTDYRHDLDDYIDPWLGSLLVRELTADVVASWQHKLATEGGKKTGRGLSPNTIRLARAPLNGALIQAVVIGLLPANPLASVPPPKPRRSIPKHWSPDEAREFRALQEGKAAAERLAHADTTLFSNLYSHVTPTMQRQAAERSGDALFADQ